MTQKEFIDVTELLVSFVILLWFSSGAWRAFLISNSRYRYVIMRDRLFLMAANGRIEFSNPAYRNLRDALNTKIESAPSSTIGTLLTFVLHTKVYQQFYESRRVYDDYDDIDKIKDESVRSDLREIENTIAAVWMDHMLLPSPALCTLVGIIASPLAIIPFLPLFAFKFGWISAWRRNIKQLENFLAGIAGTDSHHLKHIKAVH